MSRKQMNKPLVSVVMVARNMQRFLPETIESVLGQTFTDFEFVIVDYGSTDNSRQVVENYARSDARIRFQQILECSLVEARNAACALAQGRYLAIQDADDLSLPDRLKLQVDFLESHTDFGMVGGIPEWVDLNGKSMWVAPFPTDEQEIKSALLSHFPFCHTSLLIRKQAFDIVGGYRPVITQSHDYDLALRISEHFRCGNLPQVLVKYRIHPYQISLSKRNKQTLCKLAAQASAASRRAGQKDSLDSVREVTPAALVAMGVSEAQQQSDLASDYRSWIESMEASGEYAVALKVTLEALRSGWSHTSHSEIAEFYFTASRLCWKEKRIFASVFAACQALARKPQMLRRFIGPMRSRLRFV
jgi:glycosyltransferase involved in cell wall biosynthesis